MLVLLSDYSFVDRRRQTKRCGRERKPNDWKLSCDSVVPKVAIEAIDRRRNALKLLRGGMDPKSLSGAFLN